MIRYETTEHRSGTKAGCWTCTRKVTIWQVWGVTVWWRIGPWEWMGP